MLLLLRYIFSVVAGMFGGMFVRPLCVRFHKVKFDAYSSHLAKQTAPSTMTKISVRNTMDKQQGKKMLDFSTERQEQCYRLIVTGKQKRRCNFWTFKKLKENVGPNFICLHSVTALNHASILKPTIFGKV